MKNHDRSNKTTIVCDIGANSIKIGFAGRRGATTLTPERVIPTVIAVPRQLQRGKDSFQLEDNILVGDEALSVRYRKDYSYVRPIDEDGNVQDWAALETILQFALQAIGVVGHRYTPCSSSHHQILLTTKTQSTKRSDVQCLLGIFFDKFHFAAVALHEQSALVLYTQGVETGVVVELGETMTTIVPVYKGYAIPKLNKRLPVGGRSISRFLAKLLRLRGYPAIDPGVDLEAAREIKEKGSYVALDPVAEDRLAEETTVLEKDIPLSDGTTTVSIGKERFEAPEALFQPKLWDSSESKGLADLIFETIQEAAIDCRVDLFQNIILSGGSSLLPGIQQRLQSDLIERYEKKVPQKRNNSATTNEKMNSLSTTWRVQVHAPDTRRFAVYEGAVLFADLIRDDDQLWMTRSQYKETDGTERLLDTCQVFCA